MEGQYAVDPRANYRSMVITDFPRADTPYTELPPGVTYLAWAREICPTTGTPHLQAFAYGRKMKFSTWRNLFPGARLAPMRGNFTQNAQYCSKQGLLSYLGVQPMGAGQRRDLHDFCDEILRHNGKRAAVDIAVDEPDFAPTFVQYPRGLEALRQAAYKKSIKGDHSAPEVVFIHGVSGSGKTRYVRELEPDVFDVPAKDGFKWKDGYTGQDAVLYDNISPSGIHCVNQFLKELDRYPIGVSVHGGIVSWKPKRIYLTSTYKLEEFLYLFHEPTEFTRRVTQVMAL